MQRPVFFEQFQLRSGLQPERTAVDAEDATMSYAALEQESNRIAAGLVRAGVSPRSGDVVALMLEPGAAYVAALLGVSKAGAAFMPLPVELPEVRRQFYLGKAGCRHVITSTEHRDRVASDTGLKVLQPGDWAEEDGGRSPGVTIAPTDPCYVMFTSGSTGQPKAVLGSHRGLSHFLRWELAELALQDDVRGSWLAPITFDVSLRDILVPLMAGGVVCVPPEAVRTQPHVLLDWLSGRGVTLVHCVPTLLRLLNRSIEEQPRSGPVWPALRHLLVAGEPLLACDVAAWRRLSGTQAETLNLYGPSETTLAKLFLRVGEVSENDRSVLPIGRPLPNTAVLILQDQRACASGEVGEICIATPYRSLGYLGDPDLTAAAFVPNPLGGVASDVIYRSGDLGRLLPDGTVQCLGRQDGQIKLNGVRIEMAEIEAVLRRLPEVEQCACALHSLPGERSLLVAYYSLPAERTDELDPQVVRRHLEAHLPQSMLPHRIMRLASIPTTVSGKVNRKALPKPAEVYYGDEGHVEAQSPTEASLARIWGDLLELEVVGVTTDFQFLGGDSLRAIRTLMRIHQSFGIDVSLKDFYRLGTVRALAAHIDALAGQASVAPIPAATVGSALAASPGQERLWRLHCMGIAPTAYNLPAAFEVLGDVDVDLLERALQLLVRRHESLRTVFVEIDGRAHLQVVENLAVGVQRIDLRTAEDAEERAADLALQDESRAFDLVHGPLLRLTVLVMPTPAQSGPRHLLLFNIHHIVSDVWSLGVLARELGQAYDALIAGVQPDWPPLPVQQRDVLAWFAARLEQQELRSAREYWFGRFAEPLSPLDLPVDRPRPVTQTFRGGTRRRRLSAHLVDALDRMARSQQCTLFVLLQALVKVQLHRYTGQRDIVVGSPVAGRDHPDLQGQIGYLVNVLALRDRIDPEERFESFLGEVRRNTQDALNHQAYPFDLLVGGLALARDMSRSPLFDVMVVVDTFEVSALALKGSQVRPWRDDNAWNFSRFDLVFHFQREEDELVLDLNYNSDLFDIPRIDRACAHLEALIESACAAPETPVGDLNLLGSAERDVLRSVARGTSIDRPTTTIHDLVAVVAAQHPDRVAVATSERSWTYAQLLEDSRQVSARLRQEAGGVRGERVAVWARRSYGSLVGLLGALMADAVYLPLDPAYPRERIDLMLRRAGCSWVLVDDSADAQQAQEHGVRVVSVQETLTHGSGGRPSGPAPAARPHDPAAGEAAYMIFTSGSTGEPKAVVCRHDAFVNMALGQIETFGVRSTDRVLQFSSPSFDASLANIFMAWLSGAAVVLPDVQALESVDRFRDELKRTDATVVTLPPSFLRALGKTPLGNLRILVTAGEPALVDDLTHHAASLEAFNAYGPTEATVCATIHRVGPADLSRPRIPIGKPLPNLELRVVDGRGHLVPIGVPGKLLIGGAGVALGYFGDDLLTRARFIDPDASGGRFYDSGDRVRWLDDGSLDFLGRDDDQVKVSGHRIEIGEVEHAVRLCDGVSDAAVLAVSRTDGSTALAAYFCRAPKIELWPSVAEFYVYDDVVYSSMANDLQRNQRYAGAFAKHLRGKIVLDIGTGPYAILSRLAIEAGAAHVYAVDLLPATAERARETVQRLGLADRITVFQGDARTIELPQKADVCISEIVGAIGGSEGAAEIINRSRRLLKEPSAMLPQRSVTRLAAVCLPEGSFEWGFSDVAAHYVDRIFADIGRPFDLRLCVKNLPPQAILSTAGVLEDLDFTQQVPLTATHEEDLEIRHGASFTGLLAWLQLHVDAEHVVDILDNPASWLPVYLPVDLDDRSVEAGDRLRLKISRSLAPNGLNPDFHIIGSIIARDGSARPFEVHSLHFGGGFRGTDFYRRLFTQEAAPRARVTTPRDVRAQLNRRLPSFAVPAYIMELDRLPVTVSGKINRLALPNPLDPDARLALGAGLSTDPARADEATAPSRSSDETSLVEETIARVWAGVLGCDQVLPDDDFFMLGGDSIRAIQISSRLRRLGLKVEVQDVFQNPTVSALAAVVETQVPLSSQGEVSGTARLFPIHRWFLSFAGPNPHHFNQSVQIRSVAGLDRDAVRGALGEIWRHHDALRMQLPAGTSDAGSFVVPSHDDGPDSGGPVLIEVDLEGEDVRDALEAQVQRLHEGFRLDRPGPLFGGWLAKASGGDRLILAAHHFVVDRVSWDVLLEDFEQAYEAHLAGHPAVLPFKSSSVLAHSDFLQRLAQRPELDAMRLHVANLPSDEPPLSSKGLHRAGDMETVRRVLDPDISRNLVSMAKRLGHPIDDLLLAGFAISLRDALGRVRTLVDLESHGRLIPRGLAAVAGVDIDLTRTVGWFTSFVPLPLSAEYGVDLLHVAKEVRAIRDRLPDEGWTYGLVRWSTQPGSLDLAPVACVGFNHLGTLTTATSAGRFEIDWDPPGQTVGLDTSTSHALDLLSLVADGCIELTVTADVTVVSAERVDLLLSSLVATLTAAAQAEGVAEVESAPAAFTHPVTAEELDQILALD